jgi:hypothetical protein
MNIFINNALRHPLRALNLACRRLLVNKDYGDPLWDGGAIPAALQQFSVGEALPWKGTMFKVGKVVGGDFPCVILVPVDRTKGAKLNAMRNFRDLARAVRKRQEA